MDGFPGLTGVTYTSVAAGGATGNTAAGNGAIADVVNLPVGGSITYTATGTVATGTGAAALTNTATVEVVDDLNPGDNTAFIDDVVINVSQATFGKAVDPADGLTLGSDW